MTELCSVLAFGSVCFLIGLLVGAFGVLSDTKRNGKQISHKNTLNLNKY